VATTPIQRWFNGGTGARCGICASRRRHPAELVPGY
jgi:hypothetical protein